VTSNKVVKEANREEFEDFPHNFLSSLALFWENWLERHLPAGYCHCCHYFFCSQHFSCYGLECNWCTLY